MQRAQGLRDWCKCHCPQWAMLLLQLGAAGMSAFCAILCIALHKGCTCSDATTAVVCHHTVEFTGWLSSIAPVWTDMHIELTSCRSNMSSCVNRPYTDSVMLQPHCAVISKDTPRQMLPFITVCCHDTHLYLARLLSWHMLILAVHIHTASPLCSLLQQACCSQPIQESCSASWYSRSAFAD